MIEHHFSVKAPHYFVVSTEVDEDRFLNLGFVLEQVALYLVTKDLGSCFAGLRKEKNMPSRKGNRIIAVLAFGIPQDDDKSAKRQRHLPLENLCVFKDETELNIKDIYFRLKKNEKNTPEKSIEETIREKLLADNLDEEFEKKYPSRNDIKSELPDDIKAIFERIKNGEK